LSTKHAASDQARPAHDQNSAHLLHFSTFLYFAISPGAPSAFLCSSYKVPTWAPPSPLTLEIPSTLQKAAWR
jgi:hypothetical protein